MNATLATTAPEAPLILEPARFAERFTRGPFKIGHKLTDHPLFQLPRLVELALALPEAKVEYSAGNLPLDQDPKSTPRTGLSIADTIRRIEECNSWMVLRNVELDREYCALLDACLDQMMPLSETIEPGMHQREGFVIVSSPNSVTPYHIDPENNFLLQIRGQKMVHMFDAMDRVVLQDADIERVLTGGHRNLPFKEEYRTHGEMIDLVPGEGLHFPVTAPHYVKNGPNVSISFSITFRTANSRRREALYRLNSKLRRLGLRPKRVGASAAVDGAKYHIIRVGRVFKRLLGRREEPQEVMSRY